MDSIPQILDELRAGHMIVLVDDEQRENEGDLVCAAEHIKPETINFMLKHARGMMCVALDGSICDQLDLLPQAPINTSQRSTAFTISVDAAQRFGITTGVSASDRAVTARALVNDQTRPGDLDRPGHVQPLRARDGGALVRAGQTEGSVDLCRMAGLRPGAVIIEIMNEDGTMARRGELAKLCKAHNLKICSVADVINYRMGREKLVGRIASREFENDLGKFNLLTYRSKVDSFDHIALTCGDIGRVDGFGNPVDIKQPVLVRMHRQDLLGDVFGDVTRPSGATLHQAMRMIQKEGRGAVIYLQNQGTPVENKGHGNLESEAHPVSGEDFNSARQQSHGYGIGSQILRDLGISQLRLITDHPFTPTALSGFGLSIKEFVPVQ